MPEGCRVVSVETTDEMVVVKFEKEEHKFKENDVITCIDECYKWIAIYKDEINETSFNAKVIYTIQNEMFEKKFMGCVCKSKTCHRLRKTTSF